MAKFLIAEDDKLAQELVQEAIKICGDHEITVTDNGSDALLMTSQDKYELIIVDIEMPFMNGIKFIEDLRSIPGNNQYTPVIIYSNFLNDHGKNVISCEKCWTVKKESGVEMISNTIKEILNQ